MFLNMQLNSTLCLHEKPKEIVFQSCSQCSVSNKCQQKLFKEMQAEEDMARSEEREREATVSDEEMARR